MAIGISYGLRTEFKFFKDTINVEQKPLPKENICWFGGKNVIENKNVELINFEKTNPKNPKCSKYKLYILPDAEGSDTAERLKKYYQQIHDKNEKKLQKAKKDALKSKAMAQFMSNSKNSNLDLLSLFSAANEAKSKIEFEAVTKDTRSDIENKFKKIKEQEKVVSNFNKLANISKKAINSNIELVKDKQKISHKMNADLQNLNWSLEESKNKEMLQNKITTTLGIIIILFAGLCIGLMVYYMIGGDTSGKIKNKSNKGILNNIFGLNKNNFTSKNKKTLQSFFS